MERVYEEGSPNYGAAKPWADIKQYQRDRCMTLARFAIESAAPYMLVHVHHHDIEAHARSFNEGYEAAVTQGLADDPSLADDWLQAKLREARAQALEDAVDDFSVNLTAMSGPRIRAWLRSRAKAERDWQ